MIFMMVVLCFPAMPNPQVLDMNYTSVVLGGVMALALLYYYFPVYGGKHWFQGPISNTTSPHQLQINQEEITKSEGKESVEIAARQM